MKTDLNDGGFKRVWKYNIEPFIEDQLFGKPDKIKQFRLDAVQRRHGQQDMATQETDAADDSPPVIAQARGTAGNNDDLVTGQDIYDGYKAGNLVYEWMGRNGGKSGKTLREDLSSGAWRTWAYEVRYDSYPHINWFPIGEFIELEDLRS